MTGLAGISNSTSSLDLTLRNKKWNEWWRISKQQIGLLSGTLKVGCFSVWEIIWKKKRWIWGSLS